MLPDQTRLGPVGPTLADFLSICAKDGVEIAIAALTPEAANIKSEIPAIFPKLLETFITLDSEKPANERDEPQAFQDYAWQGLPMDNEADEELLPTGFTEIWLPITRTQQVMGLLREYFAEPADDHEAYRRTGLYAWELYAAQATPFWMSASHSTGEDEWKDGAFRIDPYWFAANAGDPTQTFFLQLWQLLRKHEIPFRLHWGKYQPTYEPGDRDWVDFFKAQYPRWDDFLALRAVRDPNDIFLTGYWRDRFGLWPPQAPPSQAPGPASGPAT